MKDLLNFDSPFMRGLSKVGTVVILNFFWLLFSLPILTFGAATTAYMKMLFNMREGKTSRIKDFWNAFKENFGKATLIELILILFLEIAFSIRFIPMIAGVQGAVTYVFFGLFIAITFAVLFMGQYVFGITAFYESRVPQTLRNAFLLALESPLRSFLQSFLIALPFLFYVIDPNLALKTLLGWMLVYPCISAWIISGSALKKFRQRTPKEEEKEE